MSYYYLGHCYQDLGQYKQAITYYLKVNQNQLKAPGNQNNNCYEPYKSLKGPIRVL